MSVFNIFAVNGMVSSQLSFQHLQSWRCLLKFQILPIYLNTMWIADNYFHNWVTPCSTVLLEKLTVSGLIKTSCISGTSQWSQEPTTGPYPEPDKSSSNLQTHFFKTNSIPYYSFTHDYISWVVSTLKFCTCSSYFPNYFHDTINFQKLIFSWQRNSLIL